MTSAPEKRYEFDVAVSFAGEDRDYVRQVVDALREHLLVFFDEDQQVESWGEDGVEYFTNVYMNRAKFAVIFVSAAYVEKMWTRVERRSALARAVLQREAYVLPVRLDDTDLPGLLPTVIYLDSRQIGLDGLVQALKRKAGATSIAKIKPKKTYKTPRNQAQISELIQERPPGWEYLLYGGVFATSLDALESKYRDHEIEFAQQTNQTIGYGEYVHFFQTKLSESLRLADNFRSSLTVEAQDTAFGTNGVAGDVDRITHIARRLVGVYEGFMAWSASIRGCTVFDGKARRIFDLYAKVNDPTLENFRDFRDDFVTRCDDLVARLENGENVHISMHLQLEVNEVLLDEVSARLHTLVEDGPHWFE